MQSKREHTLRRQLLIRKQTVASLMTGAGLGESSTIESADVADKIVRALVDLQEVESELRDLQGDGSDCNEPDALVYARLKPMPTLNSGAIALPLPTEPDLESLSFPPLEMNLSAAQ